ncbi:ADP-ribosylation [Vararia minispora EC-137]|uniref:ADP-ribosylation n=1 Tax=Vararia minispora EC-137 TaxID=1314806 RepID=A0ACB8Q8G8_9AGAM|nr:ADP-ribosylation [Vararia minispora EC-137]
MSNFCSRKCSDDAINAAPAIFQLSPIDASYKDVEKQFLDQWKHPTHPGTVHKIWRVIATRKAHGKFSRYQLSVERTQNLKDGNSRRRWHGTMRNCRLGDEDNESTLCDLVIGRRQCAVCSIIQSSFKLTRAGQRFNYGRFGTGIYTTGTSSKANDYVVERGGSPYRAILLNDVVLGKTKKLRTSNPTLTQPPAGFDAVVGEPGRDLNYDEAVVYSNDAIRPLFLVIFSPS